MAKEMNFEALNANLKMLDKKGELAFEQAKAAGTLTSEQEKFSALISDEAFLEKFFAADSAEEVKALFSENGLEISEEEINAFGKYIADVSKKLIENGGEISEEELEQIAGGATITEGFGFTETEDAIGNVSAGVFSVGGIAAGTLGGVKLGMAIGTAICPGWGTLIVGGLCGLIGCAAGAVSGAAGGYFGGVGVTKGIKKLGKWIKSWF